MAATGSLSDKALAVFAFAAYHQLNSGEQISGVIRRDGAGHEADPEAVAELEARGLVRAEENELKFSPEAQTLLNTMIESFRTSADQG